MSIWKRIREFFESSSSHIVHRYLPLGPGTPPLKGGEGYVQVFLSSMFLAKDRAWFTDQYPVVNASLQLKYADMIVKIAGVARPPDGMLGQGVFINYPITTLMPYRGQTIEIEAGLSALEGTNQLGVAFDVLKDFTTLVGPPVGQALGVVEKVASGVDRVLDAVGNDIALGVHYTFDEVAADNRLSLRPGYLAVIGASTQELDASKLSIRADDGILRYDGLQLEGYDYMVFLITTRPERTDWDEFSTIRHYVNDAIRAHFKGEKKSFETNKAAAIMEALTSPDLIEADQYRAAKGIMGRIKEAIDSGAGAVGEEFSLEGAVERFAPPIEAVPRRSMSLEEFLGEEEREGV